MSSCLRFAAARSLGLNGLVSGTAKMRSNPSISEMICSTSMRHNIQHKGRDTVKPSATCAFLQWPVGAISPVMPRLAVASGSWRLRFVQK